jgi:hypothetical protein
LSQQQYRRTPFIRLNGTRRERPSDQLHFGLPVPFNTSRHRTQSLDMISCCNAWCKIGPNSASFCCCRPAHCPSTATIQVRCKDCLACSVPIQPSDTFRPDDLVIHGRSFRCCIGLLCCCCCRHEAASSWTVALLQKAGCWLLAVGLYFLLLSRNSVSRDCSKDKYSRRDYHES